MPKILQPCHLKNSSGSDLNLVIEEKFFKLPSENQNKTAACLEVSSEIFDISHRLHADKKNLVPLCRRRTRTADIQLPPGLLQALYMHFCKLKKLSYICSYFLHTEIL